MGFVDPDNKRFSEAMNAFPEGVPLVMVNLLKFRENALYPEGFKAAPCTGRKAYQRYSAVAVNKVLEVGGQPLWMGECGPSLIGPADESWDEIILVKYPSMAAFLEMISMPDYQAVLVHRTAALEDSRLIPTREMIGF